MAEQPAASRRYSLSLPAVAPGWVETVNAFYRPRRSRDVSVGQHRLRIGTSWPHPEGFAADEQLYKASLQIDDAPGELVLSRAALDLVLSGLNHAVSPERLSAEQIAVVVEFALGEALELLEPALGLRISVTSVAPVNETADDPDRPALYFTLEGETIGASWCQLRVGSRHALMLARYLDQAMGGQRPEMQPAVARLSVPMRLCVGSTTLTLAEVTSLACGDIVMADAVCEQDDERVAVIAGRFAAPVRLTAEGVCFTGPLRLARGSIREWSLDHPTEPAFAGPSGMDELPVRLVYETGRREILLKELGRLGAGSVAPFEPLPRGVVALVANGARIGLGAPLRIGDSFGVRVVKLFWRSPRPSTPSASPG